MANDYTQATVQQALDAIASQVTLAQTIINNARNNLDVNGNSVTYSAQQLSQIIIAQLGNANYANGNGQLLQGFVDQALFPNGNSAPIFPIQIT